MKSVTTQTPLTVYGPNQQGTGAFDGGKITEIKPIGFPGEKGAIPRLGPLFYWAWAESKGQAVIGMHPHQGFEIVSYVLAGELGHYDTLGTRSRVGAGGAQAMKTGSGVSHEEHMHKDGTAFFQIWFEPDLREAVRRRPEYIEVHRADVPAHSGDGVSLRRIVGPNTPIELTTDAAFEVVTLEPGARWSREVGHGRGLAVVTIDGVGELAYDGAPESKTVAVRDFAVLESPEGDTLHVTAGDEGLELAIVDATLETDYPLYQKPAVR